MRDPLLDRVAELVQSLMTANDLEVDDFISILFTATDDVHSDHVHVGITDAEALEAFQLLSLKEGIIPALESSHALAYALKRAKTATEELNILVSLSGRGDKDVAHVRRTLEENPELVYKENR